MTETPKPNWESKDEIELRKRWLEFGSQDEEVLAELDPFVSGQAQQLIDYVYRHFLSFPETSGFFPDKETLERAKSAQIAYFDRLTKGSYDENYVKDRLRVGSTHYRIDLDPKWYLGAYSRAMQWFSDRLFEKMSQEPAKLLKAISAFRKIVFFDMGLAIETYIRAKETAIRSHMEALHELATEKKVTKSILENAPIGIVRLSSELACLESNQKFLEMAGIGRSEKIMGRSLSSFAPSLPIQVFEQVLLTGNAFAATAEPLIFNSDIKAVPDYFDWAVWPIKDNIGRTVGLVAKFTNASDRIMVQQQREDFVATLTHDLKTPILAANRAVKLLMDGDFGSVSEEQTKILQTIHDSNSSLYTLVLTLLDVYRYESGSKELNIAPADLTVTISHLADELRSLAQTQSIKLTVVLPKTSLKVMCDEEEIRRVIQNLVDNALKYTPIGGTITISMQQSNEETLIEVKDTGKGIADEDQPKLFQRFWQAAGSGRYYAGTGLGLFLCRKIVERHNGRIWCESKPGQGSTFRFTISHMQVRAS
ncbi:MAG: hypothetical protein K2Y22_16985 [Candidatus Obscuribacterales bacterium]|nr:hypothetical protein [Candidatus Obscuribacterales bacterium]